MSDPPRAKRAPIFIRRECPAAFEKLVETGETVQGMLLSTREQGEMVVGWPGCFFLARTFGAVPPQFGFFLWLTLPGLNVQNL